MAAYDPRRPSNFSTVSSIGYDPRRPSQFSVVSALSDQQENTNSLTTPCTTEARNHGGGAAPALYGQHLYTVPEGIDSRSSALPSSHQTASPYPPASAEGWRYQDRALPPLPQQQQDQPQAELYEPAHLNQPNEWLYQTNPTRGGTQATTHPESGAWAYQGNVATHWEPRQQYQQPYSQNQQPEPVDEITYVTASLPTQQYLGPDTQWARPDSSRNTVIYDINALQAPFGLAPCLTNSATNSVEYPYRTAIALQHKNSYFDPVTTVQPQLNPRDELSSWKWTSILIANNILAMVFGYDIGNSANIQAPILRAFGDIGILPWVGLSYAACHVAVIPLARQFFKFYDFRILNLGALLLIVAGYALAGAAPNLSSLIAGHSIAAVGTGIVFQGILSFTIIFSRPKELALVQTGLVASFAIGIITGPLIGAAFARGQATWRWAFFFPIVKSGISLLILIFCQPAYRMPTNKSVSTHLKEIDWLGSFLHIAVFVLFGTACIFTGSTWPWRSAAGVTIWTVIGVVTIVYIIQQTFAVFTTPANRIFPGTILRNRTVLLTTLCTFSSALAFGAILYYIPIFFAFVRGLEPVDAAVRLLPFLAGFFLPTIVASGLVRVFRVYMPFYISGAVLILVGGGLLHTLTTDVPDANIMGFEVIAGIGIGIIWQLAIPVCFETLHTPVERIDHMALHTVAQIGGIAIALSATGAVYENVGLQLLKGAVNFTGFSDNEIRYLLAGVACPYSIRGSNPQLLALALDAITEVIVRIFYFVLAAGALCFVSAAFMRLEALPFGTSKQADTEAAMQQQQQQEQYGFELQTMR